MLHLSVERCVTGGKDVDLLSVSKKWKFLVKLLLDWIGSRLIVQTAVAAWGTWRLQVIADFPMYRLFRATTFLGQIFSSCINVETRSCSVLQPFRRTFESQCRSPLQTLHNVCEDVKWEAFLIFWDCLNLFDTCCPGLATGNISACVSRVRFAWSHSRALTFASGSTRSSSESSVLGRAATWAQKRRKKGTSGTSGISHAAFGACWLRISQKPQSRQEAFTEIIAITVLRKLYEIMKLWCHVDRGRALHRCGRPRPFLQRCKRGVLRSTEQQCSSS